MSFPRFRPRDYLGPGEFGKGTDPYAINWHIPPGGSREFLLASAAQHVQSVTIRGAVKARSSRYSSIRHLCERPRDLPYELILGMLRGDDILRVEQIGLLVFYLGERAVPKPSDVEKAIAAVVTKEASRMRKLKGASATAVSDLVSRKQHR